MDLRDMPRPDPQAYRALGVRGLSGERWRTRQDCVAEEVPVALEFNGVSHAVMMATPADLEDFAYGFALSEGIVDDATQIYDVELVTRTQGQTVQLTIASACFERLKARRRSLTGRTGCGLCGTESLSHAVRACAPVTAMQRFDAAAVTQAMDGLRERQLLLAVTGATHAAAWCRADGRIELVREDVGRHNALDKLIGALLRDRHPAPEGFIAVTSRASYEMVHKTSAVGVGLLAAVSGVTGLAIDVAERSGLTLLGFVRGPDLSVYTHPARLLAFAP